MIGCDLDKDIMKDCFSSVSLDKMENEKEETHLHSSSVKEGKQEECGLLESMMLQRFLSC